MNRGFATSFNIWQMGTYDIASETKIEGEPSNAYRYGTLLVFVNENFSTQVYIPDYAGIFYIRPRYADHIRNWSSFPGNILL